MSQDKLDIVYVKCQLEGKPAEVYRELKRRAQAYSILVFKMVLILIF